MRRNFPSPSMSKRRQSADNPTKDNQAPFSGGRHNCENYNSFHLNTWHPCAPPRTLLPVSPKKKEKKKTKILMPHTHTYTDTHTHLLSCRVYRHSALRCKENKSGQGPSSSGPGVGAGGAGRFNRIAQDLPPGVQTELWLRQGHKVCNTRSEREHEPLPIESATRTSRTSRTSRTCRTSCHNHHNGKFYIIIKYFVSELTNFSMSSASCVSGGGRMSVRSYFQYTRRTCISHKKEETQPPTTTSLGVGFKKILFGTIHTHFPPHRTKPFWIRIRIRLAIP